MRLQKVNKSNLQLLKAHFAWAFFIRDKYMHIKFKAKVWLYKGNGAWHFITIPQEQSDQIRYLSINKRAGWGSVRVSVTIGNTNWQTSVFPSKELGAYILPLKAEVRKNEEIKIGQNIDIILKVA